MQPLSKFCRSGRGIWFAAAVLLAAQTNQASASGPFRVLFIGNSHLFVNNVPQRVQRRIATTKGRVDIRVFTMGGARLSEFAGRPQIKSALKRMRWDVVVLQEATASFLTSKGRRLFHQSVAWFQEYIPANARIVLYRTWPWRSGSSYLTDRGHSSQSLRRTMAIEYDKVARNARLEIAPVGPCWLASPDNDRFYSADGNHASVAGSELAARVIASTILRTPERCSSAD